MGSFIHNELVLKIFVVLIFGIVAATAFKGLFDVTRPCADFANCPDDFSFPSRQTTVAFAIATLIGYELKNRKLTTVFFVLAAFVGVSRLVLGVHRIEDIVFGAILGVIIGTLIVHLLTTKRPIKNIKRKSRKSR